jgi:nucleotide-binding universal stress UspA family protein
MFKHILAPLDGSALSVCALPHAMTMARAFGAQVTLLRVAERERDPGLSQAIDPVEWQIYKAEAEAYLNELLDRFQAAGLQARKALLEGQAAERIIQFVREHEVDLVVMSTHGQSGLSDWNVSSVVQKVILRTHTPVMLVRAYTCIETDLAEPHYQRLLVPLDGSQRAEYVLPLVTSLAEFHGCSVVLAHVVPRPEVPRRGPLMPDEEALVDRLTDLNRRAGVRYLEELESRMTVPVESHLLVSDDAAVTLHQLVADEEIDLVLLCAHGYTGESQWPYGGITLNFIVYGTTPLLVVQDIPGGETADTWPEAASFQMKGR